MNEKKAEILQRIRSQAKSSASARESSDSSPQPRTSTPLASGLLSQRSQRNRRAESERTTPEPVSREGTVFTPTADRELEAILGQDQELGSASGSVSVKSRPMTGVSEITDGEGEPGSAGQIEFKVKSRVTIAVDDSEVADDSEPHQESGEGAELDEKLDFVDKHTLGIPIHSQKESRNDLLSPCESIMDLKGSKSRLSVAQFSDRRSVISRDSLRERQKIDLEVNNIYSDLNERYADMIEELIRIDKGLNTKGSSIESSFSITPSLLPVAGVDHTTAIKSLEKLLKMGMNDVSEEGKEKDAEEKGNENVKNEATVENAAVEAKGGVGNELTTDGTQENFQDVEWKSYADTLSHDGDDVNDDATSYPSYDDNEDVDIARSQLSTAGHTAQASEYEDNGSDRGIQSDDEDMEPLVEGRMNSYT